MKNLIGASKKQYEEKKDLTKAFFSENKMYSNGQNGYASAIAEYLLWVDGLSARLPEGQTQRYTDGMELAKLHMLEETVSDTSPSNEEEFNNGYWDYIAKEKKRLKEFLESIDKITK